MPRPPSASRHPEPRPGFVAVGFVRAPFGLRGELAVEVLTDFPERFQPDARLYAGGAQYQVYSTRAHRGGLLVELRGLQSRAQAERLRGLLLEVPEDELVPLEEGRYYRFQIVGIEVFDRDGRPLGRVAEVIETGANDVYVVRDAEGDLLVPAIDSVVLQVDVAAARMVVDLPEGLERKPPPMPRRR